MEKNMDWITAHYQEIFAYVGILVTAATGIVALTPTTKDDEILGKIVKFIELFSVVNKK